MTATRYTVTRGKLGSPVIFDSLERIPIAVFLRPLVKVGEEEMVTEAGDTEALNRASISAQALNRIHAELVWRQQQEGGKR